MEYQKTNVNAFLGLDNNSRPELIKDQEAADIENLRFEKLGYLINRNGVENKGINLARYLTVADVKGILWGIGTMGMSEYVITKPWGPGSGTESWEPYTNDYVTYLNPAAQGNRFTDRFMVYQLRLPTGYGGTAPLTDACNYAAIDQGGSADNSINRYTWRYKAAYLLVPLMGPDEFKDAFAFAPNGFKLDKTNNIYEPRDYTLPTLWATVGSRTILRADDKPSKLQIYAPARWLGVHNTFSDSNTPKDLNWIEHYVTMNQYRDAMVISDMTNGDMLLVDEYSESEYDETKRHRFTLRENALAKFDVDDVVVDFGIGNYNEGVKAPMALYKFFLKRSQFQQTIDNYSAYYGEAERSPNFDGVQYAAEWTMNNCPPSTGFMRLEFWEGEQENDALVKNYFYQRCGVCVDSSIRYTFSSNNESDEYDDLLGPLTLQNPDIKQDDQVASDIYLWKEQEVAYSPCSGKTLTSFYLTDKDRLWDKTSSSGTKLIKLTTKSGVEQNVPLGVWRYRFVWYLGSGEYSAPSAELIVPDLLFSGISDNDIISAFGSYRRPAGIESYNDAEQFNIPLVSSWFVNKSTRLQGPLIFNALGNLTQYGNNFVNVKKAIIAPQHKYGAKYSSTLGASWPTATAWSTESLLAKAQVCVSCTLYWPNDTTQMDGVFAEVANSNVTINSSGTLRVTNSYAVSEVKLTVPLFATESPIGGNSCEFNSVFSSYGVLRTAYQNTIRNNTSPYYDINFPAYQIVLEGAQRFGAERRFSTDTPTIARGFIGSDTVQNGKQVYFNLVPFKGGVIPSVPYQLTNYTVERNNYPDNELVSGVGTPAYYQFRNMTALRGVNQQIDRLSYLVPNLPAEVTSRLVLFGSAEIQLCDYADKGTLVSQKEFWPNNNDENLAYSTQRVFSDILASGELFSGSNALTTQRVTLDARYDYYIKAPGIVFDTTPPYSNDSVKIKFDNIKVILSGSGERLTIAEQLSMYVPASLLFEAPRVKLFVPSNRIPRRARQLLVFRTRASHENAWQPHEYGLVKSIDIIRNVQTGAISGQQATDGGILFLDDVKSSELDYSYSVPDYDGFVEPIKSRFCLPLNERVFYANIKESYKPHAPRNSVKIETIDPADPTVAPHMNRNYGSDQSMARLWSHKVFTPADFAPGTTPALTTNIQGQYLYYFVAYNDQARSFSLAGFSGGINRLDGFNRPVLFGLPSAYDPAIEQLNIYRLGLGSPLSSVTFSAYTEGGGTRYRSNLPVTSGVYYVAQGLVEYNGVVYYPNSVIQAGHTGDAGILPPYVNSLQSYFVSNLSDTDRGNASTYCQPIVYNITNHIDEGLQGVTGPFIEKIGTIQPEAEGVFYDEDLPSLGRLKLKQLFQNEDTMPSALRWSEPYQPNKLKLASLMEVRAGDGDQITGMAMLYGNLIILKERSIHRLAVQGATVPVSRVDEISNNVGCIAPSTVITVNNTLYFLSWSGFYKYDNNVLSKIDGKFAEELQLRLRSAQNRVPNPAIRDASCGWNAAYRELYLNIPVMTTSNNEGDFQNNNLNGIEIADNKGTRQVRGHIYAINMDTGLVTKHRYMDDSLYFTDPSSWNLKQYPVAPTQRAPRTYSRLYHTNSLGQMRSAETLPQRTINPFLLAAPAATNASLNFMRSSLFIESPTKDAQNRDKSNDDFLIWISDPLAGPLVVPTSKFIRIFWSSKDWTAEDKSVLKRIRKVFSYIAASDDPVILRGIVHTSPMGSTATTDTAWQYTYVDSRLTSPRLNYSVTGEIMAVPTESAGSTSSPSQNRGERHTFHVEGSGAFQMEYFGFYWKPINQYER